MCSQPGSTETIGSHPSGEGTVYPGDPAIDWQGPCGTTTRHPDRATGANLHHFYVRLAEPGHLGVGITWPDPTDEFYLYVYRGRLGENAGPPPNDRRLGHDTSAASLGKRGFLFEDLDPGEYTVRVIYFAVIEGSYQGRVWSPSPVAEIVPPDSSGPGERREYPLDPGDPLFDDQWGPQKIRAPEAWREGRSTGHGITIGIVDTGLDLQHPDFSCPGKLLILPGATIGSKKAPWDLDGHGTHVAGIAGACAGNEEGGAGVAPDATIMPVNASDAMFASGFGPGSNDEAMADGIRFATDKGAHVVNLSIGPPPWEGSHAPELHPLTKEALRYAHEMGVVVVAASGNWSSPVCEFPSLSRWVVCVGATDRNDHKTYYSDFPVNIDGDMKPALSVMAPGGDGHSSCVEAAGEELGQGIVSTYLTTVAHTKCGWSKGYREMSGTSMASPFVAGVAALVYDRLGGERNETNADAVVDAILDSADDLYAPDWDPISGHGRVNALAAVQSVTPPAQEDPGGEGEDPGGDPQPQPEPEPSPSPTGPAPVYQVDLSPEESKGAVGESTTVTVTVTDPDGDPVSGAPVEWSSTGIGRIVESEATTDASGLAHAELVSNEPGSQHIVAWTETCAPEGRCVDEAIRHHGPKRCDIFGTLGDDVLGGTDAAEVICGFAGNDVVFAGEGADTVIGDGGDDRLEGAGGDDRLHGGVGRDTLRGGPGADQLFGGPGRDTCHGSSGDRLTSCRT